MAKFTVGICQVSDLYLFKYQKPLQLALAEDFRTLINFKFCFSNKYLQINRRVVLSFGSGGNVAGHASLFLC